jgi:hypothetical protein
MSGADAVEDQQIHGRQDVLFRERSVVPVVASIPGGHTPAERRDHLVVQRPSESGQSAPAVEQVVGVDEMHARDALLGSLGDRPRQRRLAGARRAVDADEAPGAEPGRLPERVVEDGGHRRVRHHRHRQNASPSPR